MPVYELRQLDKPKSILLRDLLDRYHDYDRIDLMIELQALEGQTEYFDKKE